jgi:hypothetical protein
MLETRELSICPLLPAENEYVERDARNGLYDKKTHLILVQRVVLKMGVPER